VGRGGIVGHQTLGVCHAGPGCRATGSRGRSNCGTASDGELVGPGLVRNAVTLNNTSVNVARVIGPTIAAILITTIGIGWCFIANAVSFTFVIASLLCLDARRLHPVPPVTHQRGQLRAGQRSRWVPVISRPRFRCGWR